MSFGKHSRPSAPWPQTRRRLLNNGSLHRCGTDGLQTLRWRGLCTERAFCKKLLNLHKKGSTGCEQHQSAGPPTRPVSRLAPARWRGSGRLQKRSVEHASRRRGPTHPSAILSEIRRCVASIQLALRRLAACQGYIVNSPNHWLASHNGESLRIGWSRDLRRNAGQRRGCADPGPSDLSPRNGFARK